ncbi:hypothetical protein H9P43_005227 [Blastocladiella emersonii ATCC 22665]|nr:hypothetical protein H9P43_005227 [Blastocladiella emersonii ATCC 22665]
MTKITPIDSAVEYTDAPGPKESRKCRDVFWLLLFAAYWVGMIILAILAITNGDPRRLVLPTDSYGNLCGIDNTGLRTGGRNLTATPYLYFFDPTDGRAKQVCVSACPRDTTIPLYTKLNYICDYGVVPANQTDLAAKQMNGTCAAVTYESQPIINRCLPSGDLALALGLGLAGSSAGSAQTNASTSSLLTQGMDFARVFVQDMLTTWPWMLGALGASVVVCFLWLLCLRVFAGVLTWVSLVAVEGGLAGFAYYTFTLWQASAKTNAAVASPSASDVQTEKINLGLFIFCVSLASLFLVIMVALRNRIRIAIAIIKESSKAVTAMPLIVAFPLIPYVLIVLLTAYYAIVAVYIETSNDVTDLGKIGIQQSITYIKYFQWYHLFGFLWTLAFLVAINQTTIAGAIATWYWARDKRQMPRTAVLRSFWRTVRYSLGSLALGSFVIAVTQLIRFVLAYLQRQLRGSPNKAAKFLLACLQCCFACLERFLKFLNKNAYILIAVNGTSFCTSARTAGELLVRNAFRLIAVDFVAGFLLFLSKVVVAGGTAFGLYAVLNYTNSTKVTAAQTVGGVCLVVLVAAWMVVSCFFGVYRMAIDTVFLSFCEDCERNDGSPAKPYFMSEGLAALTSVRATGAPLIANQGGAGAAAPVKKMKQV